MGVKRTGGSEYVLIAEDDQALAELLVAVVELADATPLVAYDGRQALALARTCTPALVITDLMMPRMSGDALIAVLRQEFGADLPVILVSAAPRADLLKVPADAILSKPFDLVDLQALVAHYLAAASADRLSGAEGLWESPAWAPSGRRP